jgi:hypothetical protein
MVRQRKFGLDMTKLENAQYSHFSACKCPGHKFIGEFMPRPAALSVHGVALYVMQYREKIECRCEDGNVLYALWFWRSSL